jgi:hypothetical protein
MYTLHVCLYSKPKTMAWTLFSFCPLWELYLKVGSNKILLGFRIKDVVHAMVNATLGTAYVWAQIVVKWAKPTASSMVQCRTPAAGTVPFAHLKTNVWAKEVPQHLRALAALAETQTQSPEPTRWLTTICSLSFRRCNAFFYFSPCSIILRLW